MQGARPLNLNWSTIKSHVKWQGRFQVIVDEIQADHDGRTTTYTYLAMSRGAVVVLALDEQDRAICVRQYRHPTRQVMLELPAGHIDPGEDPTAAAYREFEEETGMHIGHLEPLGSYVPVPALARFPMHMYFGHTLRPGRQHLDDNEILELDRIPIRDLHAAIIAGSEQAVSLTYTVLLAASRSLLPI